MGGWILSAFNSTDYFYEVASGNIAGSKTGAILGTNSSISSTTTELVWPESRNYTYLTENTTLFISSSDSDDTDVDFVVIGMNDNYVEIFLFATTHASDGQTQVEIPGGDMFRVFNIQTIGTKTPVGIIYVAESTALTNGKPTDVTKIKGTVPLSTDLAGNTIDTGTIYASRNNAQMGLYTVPDGFNFRPFTVLAGAGKDENLLVGTSLNLNGDGIWVQANPIPVYQQNTFLYFGGFTSLPPRTDIEFRAVASSPGSFASITSFFILEGIA